MNVKHEGKTYYVRANHKLVVMEDGKVFAVGLNVPVEEGEVELKADVQHVEDVKEFVVKMIDNGAVYTEPDKASHTATVLRIGDLPSVNGESEEFFRLSSGGFVEKSKCRKYNKES